MTDTTPRADFNKAAPPEAGTLTNEGVYIGRFRDKDGTRKDWFADIDDARDKSGKRLSLDFEAAAAYAGNSNALGHNDWTVPSGWKDGAGRPDILDALYRIKDKFNNRSDGVQGFDDTGPTSANWYRSSSVYAYADHPKIQRFTSGYQSYDFEASALSLRSVRSLTV